jgi:hypothetical protein
MFVRTRDAEGKLSTWKFEGFLVDTEDMRFDAFTIADQRKRHEREHGMNTFRVFVLPE